jgi:hypothetical protein
MIRPGIFLCCLLLASSGYVCYFEYSSDDCSGDRSRCVCSHDGHCQQLSDNVMVVQQCEPGNTGFSEYQYQGPDVDIDCNGTVISKDTYANNQCFATTSGGTSQKLCTVDVPEECERGVASPPN